MELEQRNSKFITSFNGFLEQITPQIKGCFWISQSSELQKEKPFSWFNYLFNGILTAQVQNFSLKEKSFFFTKQFDREFYLMIIHASDPQLGKNYLDFLNMLQQQGEESILLLSTKNYNLPKETTLPQEKFKTIQRFY